MQPLPLFDKIRASRRVAAADATMPLSVDMFR